jgi:hypothetical protein
VGTGVGRRQERGVVYIDASTEGGVGDDEDGLGWESGMGEGLSGRPTLETLMRWTRRPGRLLLVQDQPSGRQISLPPRVLTSSSSSSSTGEVSK